MTAESAVFAAIEKLNYRVTLGDVATQAGLSLNLVQPELLKLATNTGGNLQVSETGEIVYVFSPQFRQILRDRFWQKQLQAWLAQVWQWLFYLVRISFGIVLILSIAIVVVAIILALVALQSRGSDDDRSDDRGIDLMPIFWWIDFGDLFIPRYGVREVKPKGMGFLESIFSFLFGDGNPNFDLEERRNRLIAQVIRHHQGVVIAEQITPYLDQVNDTLAGYEDYMIPVLAQFNGLPQVTESGTLAYTFPELQKSATQTSEAPSPYLQERPWQFSKAGLGRITLAIALGIFYLVAALFLGNLLSQLGGELGGFLGLVAGSYGFLLGYAILFLTIPTVRYFIYQILNNKINGRNQQRRERVQRLSEAMVKQKLDLAQQFSIATEVIGTENLAYTTETDLNDQEYAKMFKPPSSP